MRYFYRWTLDQFQNINSLILILFADKIILQIMLIEYIFIDLIQILIRIININLAISSNGTNQIFVV